MNRTPLTVEPAFKCFGHVPQQVPPIRDLDGIRRAVRDTFFVRPETITADDFNAGMSFKPRGKRRGFTIR